MGRQKEQKKEQRRSIVQLRNETRNQIIVQLRNETLDSKSKLRCFHSISGAWESCPIRTPTYEQKDKAKQPETRE